VGKFIWEIKYSEGKTDKEINIIQKKKEKERNKRKNPSDST
jgi:hypothetical protein